MTTKTIRFNKKERIIYDNWDYLMVREFKKFMFNKLTAMQKTKFKITNAEDPEEEKKKLVKEKIEKMKFLMKKGCTKAKLDQLEEEIREISNLVINDTDNEETKEIRK